MDKVEVEEDEDEEEDEDQDQKKRKKVKVGVVPRPFPVADMRQRLEQPSTFQGSSQPQAVIDLRSFTLQALRELVARADSPSPADAFSWPTGATAETMVSFLMHVGLLGATTPPNLIVKYILTLDRLNSNANGCYLHNVHAMFGQGHAHARIFHLNVSFFRMLSGSDLPDTPFADWTDAQVQTKADALLTALVDAQNLARECRAILRARDLGQPLAPLERLAVVAPPPSLEERKLQPHQKLLEHLFQQAAGDCLRRSKTAVYRPVYADGHHTLYFERYKDFEDWIHEAVTPSDLAPELYDAYTLKPSTPAHLVALLSKLADPRFPFMRRERTLFSYRNGVFDAVSGLFHLYADGAHPSLRADVATSNFFDVVVPADIAAPESDARAIPTPAFEKIMADQDFDSECRFWLYALTGRLLHNVSSLDNWQVALYILGVAGSGKSVWLRSAEKFYEPTDVGHLNDDAEDTFGSQHLVDKYMVLCIDVSSNLRLPTTRFNQYVSGESVVINRKFLTAVTMDWTAPFAFASNTQPPIDSKAGSGARRFVIFTFNNSILRTDTNLGEQCKTQVPLFLIKCARLYLQAVRRYGQRGLWDEPAILPAMAYRARRDYLVAACPIAAFLDSDAIERAEDAVVSVKKLAAAFRSFLSDNRQHGVRSQHKGSEQTFNRTTVMSFLTGCRWFENPTAEELARYKVSSGGFVVGIRLRDDVF